MLATQDITMAEARDHTSTVFLNVGADFETHYASSGVTAVVLLAVWLYLANAVLLAGYQSAIEFERMSSTPSHAEGREGDVVERG